MNKLISTKLTNNSNSKSNDIDMYKELFEHLTVGFAVCEIICDKKDRPIDYRFLLINPAFEENSGIKIKGAIGKTIREIYPDVEQNWIDFYGVVAQTQKSAEMENYNHNTDKYYSVKSFSFEKGKFVMLFSDITDRKEIEDLLRVEKNYSVQIIDSMPGLFYQISSEGRFINWNKNFESISGYSAEEIALMNPTDLFEGEYKKHIASRIQKTFKEGSATAQAHFTSKDGTKTPYLFTGELLNVDSKPQLLGMGLDITERKKAEFSLQERLKELNCLYGISKIFETSGLSLEEIFHKVVSLVPPSWQYPEITVCRIIIDGIEYKNTNFKKTDWMQSSEIRVNGKNVGIIEICYLEEMPHHGEGPFLKGEKLLIDSLAERLGHMAGRFTEENTLQEANVRHAAMIENIGDVIAIVGSDGLSKYQSQNIEK